jgi:hypothetical protein
VVGARAAPTTMRAAAYLSDAVARRSGMRWEVVRGAEAIAGDVVLAMAGDGAPLPPLVPSWPEEVVLWRGTGGPAFAIAGGASVAVAAAGALARAIDLRPGHAALGPVSRRERPAFPVRGHTFANHKQNTTHDKWEWSHWEEYLTELAAWGSNIAIVYPLHPERWRGVLPFGDGAHDPSRWFASPAHEAEWHRQWEIQRRLPGLCRELGIRYGAWISVNDVFPEEVARHPELTHHGGPYVCPARPEARRRMNAIREQIFRALPHLDVLFLPSKDDGGCPACEHCTPWGPVFLELAQEQIALARRFHPECRLWVSTQGLREEETHTIVRWLDQARPEYVEAVAYGPLSEIASFEPPLTEALPEAARVPGAGLSLREFSRTGRISGPVGRLRAAVPGDYRVILYPDETHSVRAQYGAVDMDPAVLRVWQRQDAPTIRPREFAAIHAATSISADGSAPYTEGDHDDVNKFVWSALDWDPTLSGEDVAQRYASWFFGAEVATEGAKLILAVEEALRTPLSVSGPALAACRGTLDASEARAPALLENWRWLNLRIAVLMLVYIARVTARDRALAREMRYRLHAFETLLDPVPGLESMIAYLEEQFSEDSGPLAETVWTRDALYARQKLAIRGVPRLQHSYMLWDSALVELRDVRTRLEAGELASFEERRAALRRAVMRPIGFLGAPSGGTSLVPHLQEFSWETGEPTW